MDDASIELLRKWIEVGAPAASPDALPVSGHISEKDRKHWAFQPLRQSTARGSIDSFVVAALLYNLALGAINRAMPQLMVSFVGAPALTLGGLALLALSAPVILTVWRTAMDAALTTPLGG